MSGYAVRTQPAALSLLECDRLCVSPTGVLARPLSVTMSHPRKPLIHSYAPGMTSRRPAGCVARRRADWPSVQAARRSLRAFWTSPPHFNSIRWGRTVCAPRFVPPPRQTTSLPSPARQTEARIQCG